MMTSDGPSYHFAYYCSGHGFGHATRVTEITARLLRRRHRVTIVSSAPEKVFESVLMTPALPPSHTATYRFAIFEPTVVQPKAYLVDRLATFNNLSSFLSHKRLSIIEQERQWLLHHLVDCVLIDAPFLPCAAASEAKIPSVIISNFTFDSCYSYLSAFDVEEEEQHIEAERLNALVAITVDDYSKAELLLRLPGELPIPGFDADIELPSAKWLEERTGLFRTEIEQKLQRPMREELARRHKTVIDLPLIVRPLSGSAYDPQTKLALLNTLGVPAELQKYDTKILLVSFGGQVIPSPRPPTSTDHDITDSAAGSEIDLLHNSLLPPGWIAIICGLPSKYHAHDIPDRFFSIGDSKFHYVPDLTAIADVVLGKLGYGTCSEVIATRTPFISVPRKMFLEEYGLRRLMRRTCTVNVEMSIRDFEEGRWASYVLLAERLGRQQQKDLITQSSPTTHVLHDSIKKTKDNALTVDIVVDHLEVFMSHKKMSLPSA